ncbi:hypothetical protein J3R30DRAFT_3407915 [Lentinula aciculospora]|uniref:FAD-binding domain-containing protein n=1 Tax=Lentinula aciculospora TaxID=153920 RepID=A0A9W9DIW8_9AGAR|nr:hypothetical protein J3R30DRAFT_3407915 [Lentinula aciculospora]
MGSLSSKKLRVAIVGGGIGGLTCAAALKDCRDTEIDLFEAAAKFIAIGAGIVTWPRTWSVLNALGSNEKMLEKLRKMDRCEEVFPAWEFRLSDATEGKCVQELYYKDATPTNLHRQQLLDLLLENLPPQCKVHFGHRLVSCREYEDFRGVELRFRNGTVRDRYDLVIGADGLKSVVRQAALARSGSRSPVTQDYELSLLLRENLVNREGETIFCIPVRVRSVGWYQGRNLLRCILDTERFVHLPSTVENRRLTILNFSSLEIIQIWILQHVVVYPISNGEIVNVVAFFADSQSGSPAILETAESSSLQNNCVSTETVVDIYPGWEDEVVDLLKDAYILGTLISKSMHTASDINHVLSVYDSLRRPYGNEIMRWAREMGEYYEFDSQDVRVEGNKSGLVNEATDEDISIFCKGARKYWSWPVRMAGTIGEDLKRAQGMLIRLRRD